MAVAYCPRCGFRSGVDEWGPPFDPRCCWYCFDGEADETRARELVEAAATGQPDVLLMLSEIRDARAFDVLHETVEHDDPSVRCAALDALGLVGDVRAVGSVVRLLGDPDTSVRACAVACLAELGSAEAADALAERLDDEAIQVDAAMALAWLRDSRAFDPLVHLLARPRRSLTAAGNSARTPVAALGWLEDVAAVPHLIEALEQVAQLWEESEAPLWWARLHAEDLARTLLWFGGEAAEVAVNAAEQAFGGFTKGVPFAITGSERLFSYPQEAEEGRSVPKWSLELRKVDTPITEPVTKFGGQPVWLRDPTWPLTRHDTPMTFFAQFRVPWRRLRLAYLFIDVQGGVEASDDGAASVIVQPGALPDRFELRQKGPTYVSALDAGLTTFKPRRIRQALVESAPTLTHGHDPLDWNADVARRAETDFDWNKLGGTPLFLQGDDWPGGEGWRFVAQFTAALIGHELGDVAECYVFVADDGRGAFVVQSH